MKQRIDLAIEVDPEAQPALWKAIELVRLLVGDGDVPVFTPGDDMPLGGYLHYVGGNPRSATVEAEEEYVQLVRNRERLHPAPFITRQTVVDFYASEFPDMKQTTRGQRIGRLWFFFSSHAGGVEKHLVRPETIEYVVKCKYCGITVNTVLCRQYPGDPTWLWHETIAVSARSIVEQRDAFMSMGATPRMGVTLRADAEAFMEYLCDKVLAA